MGVRISELSIPGCELIDSANNYVVSVKTSRAALDEEVETEAAAEGDAAEGEASTEAAAE